MISLTNVGVAQAYTNPGPKGDFCVVSVRTFFVNFFMHGTKQYLNGQSEVTLHPEHPKWDQYLQFTPQSDKTIDRGASPSLLYGSPPGPSKKKQINNLRKARLDRLECEKFFLKSSIG